LIAPRLRRVSRIAGGLLPVLLVAALCDLPAAVRAREAQPAAAPPAAEVLFVSTRALREADEPADRFDGGRGPPRYGSCRVVYDDIPVVGHLANEVDFYLPTRSEEVAAVDLMPPEDFWQRLERSRRLVVYVHGYSFSFERGCQRAAAMQRVLGAAATVLLFTWPSNGNPAAYNADVNDMEWSAPRLAGLLAGLRRRFHKAELVLVAHSLGTRGAVQALLRLRIEQGASPLLDQLVLVAPDYDTDTFLEQLPLTLPLVRQITVYASADDAALLLSQRLNGRRRLGQGGDALVLSPAFETIDVSPLRRYRISAHEYHHFHPVAAADFLELLRTGARAAERRLPRPQRRNGITYWLLEPPADGEEGERDSGAGSTGQAAEPEAERRRR
jgi:esterase/lipase superfamily enzyme